MVQTGVPNFSRLFKSHNESVTGAKSCNPTLRKQGAGRAQPKKQASGSASISCTKSLRRLLDESPRYWCHFRSARIQYSRHLFADRMNLSLATGVSIHSALLSHRGRRSAMTTSWPFTVYASRSLSLRCPRLRLPQKTPTVCSIRLRSTSLKAMPLAIRTREETIPTRRSLNCR